MEKKKTPEEAIIQALEDIIDNYTYEQYFTDDEYEAVSVKEILANYKKDNNIDWERAIRAIWDYWEEAGRREMSWLTNVTNNFKD